MAKYATIDEYIKALPKPLREVASDARRVIDANLRGASIDDPSGRLETSGEVMAHTKLRTRDDIDAKLFAKWLHQARALEQP